MLSHVNLIDENPNDDKYVTLEKYKKTKAIFGITFFLLGAIVSLIPFLTYTIIINKQRMNKKPLIGIVSTRIPPATTSPFVNILDDKTNQMYIKGVQQAGGVPLTITGLEIMTDEDIEYQVSQFDGILFQGGDDISPELYNETKDPLCENTNLDLDLNQIHVFKAAKYQHKPIFGICRGCQLINVASGGSLYQDLSLRDLPPGIQSDDHHHYENWSLPIAHNISIEKNSILYESIQKEIMGVNSLHHQTIKKLADGFKIIAKSPDGTIEGIELINKNDWIVGYQFHPEALLHGSDEFLPLWTKFIQQAEYKRKKKYSFL